jgi:diacylglycerol kinase (ATP)
MATTPSPRSEPGPTHPAPGGHSAYKSRNGLQRLWRAAGYSWAGVKAAFQHEAAFRQELLVGLPMVVAAWWVAATPLQAVALVAVVVLVWIVELLNSAIEALADGITVETHPMMGRAKDLGSAAVLAALLLAVLTWGVVIWGRLAA